MQDKKTQTINTYNESASALARKFDKTGARVGDIEETFALVDKKDPSTLEIGCGNGRDAQEILKHTDKYLGIDISEKLIDLAREKNPQGIFEEADIENYQLPANLDVIFAFASLIHVPKESFKKILADGLRALHPGGVFRLSMKHADSYRETTKEDEFGTRHYYLYSKEDIEELARGYAVLKLDLVGFQDQAWLEVLLQKPVVSN